MGLPGPETFERAGLAAWPGIEVEWDRAWVRRAASGYTQRANSVQSLDPADDGDVPARLAASRAWFECRGLPPIFRVTPLAGPRILAVLDGDGWGAIDASHVFAMALGDLEPDPRGLTCELLDPRFLAAQQALRGYTDERLSRLRAVLAVVAVPARGLVLYSAEGRPLASALMAIADGIAIAGNVVTEPGERRKGHGAAMMRTGLAWAKAAGARIAALNVAADNVAGKALYTKLGYRRHYDYVYRVPPVS